MNMKLMYLYYAIHFFYGLSCYIYGPYIPFLAELSGKPESYFFPMFLAKGIGYLVGPVVKMILFPNF